MILQLNVNYAGYHIAHSEHSEVSVMKEYRELICSISVAQAVMLQKAVFIDSLLSFLRSAGLQAFPVLCS